MSVSDEEPREAPFSVGYVQQPDGKFTVILQINELRDMSEVKALGDALANWIISDGGWKQRVQ